jgi:hypothetical protein
MSRRIWARVALTVLLTLLAQTARPPAPAQAQGRQVALSRLAGLQGRVVVLERHDGQWLLVRILEVGPTHVIVELEDGLRGRVRISDLAKVHDQWRDDLRWVAHVAPPERRRPAAPPHKFRVEWIGLRGGIGLATGLWEGGSALGGFAELTLFVLHWRHFYWEILRAGGGYPHYGFWGTALGYPFHLDDQERHELRLGLHISFWLGYLPTLSGVQLYYMYRPSPRLALQIGIMQTSYPFSLTLMVGISM